MCAWAQLRQLEYVSSVHLRCSHYLALAVSASCSKGHYTLSVYSRIVLKKLYILYDNSRIWLSGQRHACTRGI